MLSSKNATLVDRIYGPESDNPLSILLTDKTLVPVELSKILMMLEMTLIRNLSTDTNKPRKVVLNISTKGGPIDACYSIIGLLHSYENSTSAIARIHAQSIGVLLLASVPGTRLVHENTILMCHDFHITNSNTLETVRSATGDYNLTAQVHGIYKKLKDTPESEMDKPMLSIKNMVSYHVERVIPALIAIVGKNILKHGKDPDKFYKLIHFLQETGQDVYLSTEEALDIGLVDDVVRVLQ